MVSLDLLQIHLKIFKKQKMHFHPNGKIITKHIMIKNGLISKKNGFLIDSGGKIFPNLKIFLKNLTIFQMLELELAIVLNFSQIVLMLKFQLLMRVIVLNMHIKNMGRKKICFLFKQILENYHLKRIFLILFALIKFYIILKILKHHSSISQNFQLRRLQLQFMFIKKRDH